MDVMEDGAANALFGNATVAEFGKRECSKAQQADSDEAHHHGAKRLPCDNLKGAGLAFDLMWIDVPSRNDEVIAHD